jgi:hypothetical protein
MSLSGPEAKLAFRVPPQVVPSLLDSCENLSDAQKNVLGTSIVSPEIGTGCNRISSWAVSGRILCHCCST